MLLLAACGGGGGTSDPGFIGGGAGGGDEPGTDTTTFSVSLVLTDPTGAETTRISSSSPGTLTVTITTSEGVPVVGEIAVVTADLVAISPSSAARLTDENGVAVFTLSASSDSGPGTATVSYQDASDSVNYEVDALLSLELTDTLGNPIVTISDSNPGILTVTSSDSIGDPIVGELVNVATTAGDVSPTTALTDDNGEAIFVLEAGAGFGAGTVTATAGNRNASVNFDIVTTTADTNILQLTLTDSAGNPVTNVTNIAPAILTVTATNSQGAPLASEVLSAQSLLGVAVVTPESGTALTDLNGIATFTVSAGDILGADTVQVSLGVVDETVSFQIGEANLKIGRFSGSTFIEGEIEAGATSLPAGGSTPLTVAVVDQNDTPVTTTVPVVFGSGCANLTPPLSQITAEVNTVNGFATSTYTASGCTGTDNVTAGIVQGNTQAATVALTIATADVNSVSFVAADPISIALKGTGGQDRSETSNVSFQVLDTTGAPVPGVDVSFTLSTTIGGLSLTNPSATTNGEGIASAIVQAGNVSTSVRVTATITVSGGTDLSTVSDRLVVSTGLPDNNSVSISSTVLNLRGGDIDGVTSEITVRMADKFNNPVPDGTVAFFTTEYGAVGDSCETVGGACNVTFTSQDPRLPLQYNTLQDDPPPGTELAYVSTINNRVCPETGLTGFPCLSSLGPIYGLRNTIAVIAIGEESFTDDNGNGVYDVGEFFEDLPEAFLDRNEDGVFGNDVPLSCTVESTTVTGRECAEGTEEIFFDFDVDNQYDGPNGLYNGSLCPQALEAAGQCSRNLVHVRDDIRMVLSSAVTYVTQEIGVGPGGTDVILTGGITMAAAGADRSFRVVVGDFFNNPPPGGTTVSIEAEGCEVIANSDVVGDGAGIGSIGVGFTVRNQSDNAADLEGTVSVTVDDSTTVFPCTDIAF